MKTRITRSGPDLAQLASRRLLNAGPESCKRLERDAVRAIEAAQWDRARSLLHLRIRLKLAPTPEERKVIDRVLELIDEAEAKGIGPASLVGESPSGASGRERAEWHL